MNPAQFMQIIRNPQGFIQNVMQNNKIMQNPMASNALQMMQNGDNKGLEKMARNLCKEYGVSADEAIQRLKKQYNIQ